MIKMKKYFYAGIVITILSALVGCSRLDSPLEPVTSGQPIDFAPKVSSAPGRYIVLFNNAVNSADEEQIRRAGGSFIKRLQLINGAAVFLPAQAVAALQNSPNVRSIEIDRVVQIPVSGISAKGGNSGRKPPKDDPPEEDPPPEVLPWGVDRIDADLVWSANSGGAIKVGIIDTGIDPGHPDLNVAGGVNTINTRKSFKDDNGHGTHVAGTVAAVDNELGVIGVAHSVELYAIKAFNKRGLAFTSDIIEGIQWCVENEIQVINMSFGSSVSSSSEQMAIQAAYAAGVVMVAAAGNTSGSVGYPAAYGETIAVSASDASDAIAGFSSRGTEVDLIAPGVNILSTYKGGYAWGSGTSMATPHVTGAAALVLAVWNGSLFPAQVLDKLKLTAENIGLTPSEQGAGLVDAELAVITP